jgi:hypothetical protein
MRPVLFIIVFAMTCSACLAQNIFDKAIEALKKGVERTVDKESKRITGDDASIINDIKNGRANLFGEAWSFMDNSSGDLYIIKFHEDYTYEFTIKNHDAPTRATTGTWNMMNDYSEHQISVLLDGIRKFNFLNARQLNYDGKLFRKTPSYLIN